MSKVHFSFGSIKAFEALSEKDSGTLYVINQTGDFSDASLDDDGLIFLGDKLLSGSAKIPVVKSCNGVLEPNNLYLLGQLENDVTLKLSPDFDETVMNKWEIIFSTGSTAYNFTILPPDDDEDDLYEIKGLFAGSKVNTFYKITLLYAGHYNPAMSSPGLRRRLHVFLMSYMSY